MTFLRWYCSPATAATAIAVRCHSSWWSTSATVTLKVERRPFVSALTTWRFSFNEPHPGTRRSNRSRATHMASDRARDLLDLVGLDHVAFLDVGEVLQPDATL